MNENAVRARVRWLDLGSACPGKGAYSALAQFIDKGSQATEGSVKHTFASCILTAMWPVAMGSPVFPQAKRSFTEALTRFAPGNLIGQFQCVDRLKSRRFPSPSSAREITGELLRRGTCVRKVPRPAIFFGREAPVELILDRKESGPNLWPRQRPSLRLRRRGLRFATVFPGLKTEGMIFGSLQVVGRK